jgi:hypothetical protein
MYVKWKLVSLRLEIVLATTQDRCPVCTERTIAPKIILGATDGLLRDAGQVETRFGPFRDSVNLDAR